MNPGTPTRILPEKPDLDQLRRQAKELLDGWRQGDPNAKEEIRIHYSDARREHFALHDAQLVLARAYGFESWPKLKAFVDDVTIGRLRDAVLANDEAHVTAMLKARPELINLDMGESNEHRVIHYAVLQRLPRMVRLLMQHSADARKGIYPHRDATGALTIAKERGYDEIATIIEEEEARRQQTTERQANPTMRADAVTEALARGDTAGAESMLAEDPALARATNRNGWTLLHVASAVHADSVVQWLLAHGADADARGPGDRTPLDQAAGHGWQRIGNAESFAKTAQVLRDHGAALTARAAAAIGDTAWLRARHAEGSLANPIEDWGGLLSIAVHYNQANVLAVLLELGFDPNEETRLGGLDETVYTSGMPLWYAAVRGRHEMAELLLAHGANPNANVYASGTPAFQAHGTGDAPMLDLLERYGARLNPDAIGHHRETERAARMFAEADEGRFPEGFPSMEALAAEMLWSAACGGDPEIVRMCLSRIDWPEGDARWFWPMQQPLRLWNHMGGFWDKSSLDRSTYLPCLQQILDRSGANVVGRYGLTLLHDVAALRDYVTAAERVAFAQELLDRRANLRARDELLQSTPLGWACRWGRKELVELLLAHGADPVEADAEPWATPNAWAEKRGHREIREILERAIDKSADNR